MNCATDLHPDVVPAMKNPELALHASQDPSFKTARNDTQDDVTRCTWYAALDNEGGLSLAKWQLLPTRRRQLTKRDVKSKTAAPTRKTWLQKNLSLPARSCIRLDWQQLHRNRWTTFWGRCLTMRKVAPDKWFITSLSWLCRNFYPKM